MWTSHQVTVLNEMSGVVGEALEIKRRNELSEANTHGLAETNCLQSFGRA